MNLPIKRVAYNTKKGNTFFSVSSNSPEHMYSDANGYKDYKPLYVQTVKYTYEGEFKHKLVAGPSADECNNIVRKNQPDHAIRNPSVVWLYHTLQDINYFNNEVFADWLYLIQTEGALIRLLSDIRNMLTSNPELIVLNKINNCLGPYIRSQNKDNVCWFDQPFGAPLINLNESYVLPYKYYHPEFVVDRSVDDINIKYDNKRLHNNIVNMMRPNVKSSNYKQYNYLDNAYTTMYNLCKAYVLFDNNMSMAVTVPKRGCQLFEAVSDNQDNATTQRINNGGELVRLLSTNDVTTDSIIDGGKVALPRLIAKVGTPLSGAIAEAYDNISAAMDVHIPIINVKKNANNYTVSINTSSEDKDNKLLVYMAKSAKSLGSYSAKVKNYINSKTNTQMNVIDISYDGNETKETPVLLMRRFK